MIVSDTEVRTKFTYFFARPSDALGASADKVGSAYGALIAGCARRLRADHRDHRAGGAADLRRPRRRRSPSGPGCSTSAPRARRSSGRSSRRTSASALHLPPGIHLLVAVLGGLVGGGDLGRPRRLAQGQGRRARGDRDDHDELHRRRAAGLPAHHHGVPAAGPDRPDLADRRLERHLPPAARAASCTSASSLALLAAVAVWWLLDRSTTGFAIRAVGANPHAAATAGHERRPGPRSSPWRRPARWPAWPASRRRSARRPPGCPSRSPPASSARSVSTPSPSRCSAGPSRSAPCWPGCCSARCTPAAWPCRASPRRR